MGSVCSNQGPAGWNLLISDSLRNGGPIIEWFRIQEKFEHVSADILLLLDCCFGAQAGRSRLDLPNRVELLAASAMGVTTPLPGPQSFTNALIRSIEASVADTGEALVSKVHTSLVTKEYRLVATPVYIKIRHGSSDKDILLQPLNDKGNRVAKSETGPSIRLLIRTAQLLNRDSVDAFVNWLSSDIPSSIVALQVEEVFQSNKRAHSDIGQMKIFEDAQECLELPLQRQLASEWMSLRYQLENLDMQQEEAIGNYSAPHSFSNIGNIIQRAIAIPQRLLGGIHQEVMKRAVSDKETLETLLRNVTSLPDSLGEQLRLYWVAHVSNQRMPVNEAAIHNSRSVEAFYKESKSYSKVSASAEIDEVESRISHLAELLQAPKSDEFKSLKCQGWFHEPSQRCFTLIFAKPAAFSNNDWSTMCLQDVIKHTSSAKRPTLDQRYDIALQIAKALQKWHQVSWVHQSVSSHNVIFFRRDTDVLLERGRGDISYSAPFLQGLDFARPNQAPSLGRAVEDPEHDIYRHPKRQGPARQGHRKIHDIYSLGVVLLEIGLWQCATSIVPIRQGKNFNVTDMVQRLIDAADSRLAHYAGSSYRDAVIVCLTGGFNIQMDDVIESRLDQAFKENVIDKLIPPVIPQ